MGGLDKAKDSVEPKDTKSLPVVTIQAEHRGPGFVVATATDEAGNILDSHVHSSESWLLQDWGFTDHLIYMNYDKGYGRTDVMPGTDIHHHEKIYSLLKQPFVLRYLDKQVTVNDLELNSLDTKTKGNSKPPKEGI